MKKYNQIVLLIVCTGISAGVTLKIAHTEDLTMTKIVAYVLICLILSTVVVSIVSLPLELKKQFKRYKTNYDKMNKDAKKYKAAAKRKINPNTKILLYDKLVKEAKDVSRQGKRFIKNEKFGSFYNSKIAGMIKDAEKIINNNTL